MRLRPTALLAIPALAACDADSATPPAPRQVTLAFEAYVGDQVAACGPTYAGIGTSSNDVSIADARLFVSAIELRSAAGAWIPLVLDAGSDWQHADIALLDFEDGTGPCADSGTALQNRQVSGSLPAGDYDAVRFTVGVPYALNHVDSAAAPAPLNAPGMFWVWRGGYKFARVDFVPVGGPVARWNVHLGSTGCMSAAPTTPPDAPCSRTNAAVVELSGFDPAEDTIAIDLAQLVAGADLAVNTPDSPPGCMSAPEEPDDCTAVFSSLGVDFATGASPAASTVQTIFSVR